MSYRILIAEDDENIAKYISTCLTIGGYEGEICFNGREAIERSKNEAYDLILLDIMLPEADGFEVLEQIRGNGIPVIFLTALQDVTSKVKGLKSGAEDYIVKPFETLELLARIEVALRRNQKEAALQYGSIRIGLENHTVLKDGKEIILTPKEFSVLTYFIRNQDVVVSRERLLADIWGYDFAGETRTVDTHVQQVRKKLCLQGALITVPKCGYRLEKRE